MITVIPGDTCRGTVFSCGGETPMDRCAVVLAAAEDERMQTKQTKVMLPVAGRPLVSWVRQALDDADVRDQVYVVSFRQEQVRELLGEDVVFVLQEQPLGTAHAVRTAEPFLSGREGACLVLSGDIPLIRGRTLSALLTAFEVKRPALMLLTSKTDHPRDFGRIVRDESGRISRIVEENDASDEEKKITEINCGVYCFEIGVLKKILPKITARGREGFYHLTDLVGILRSEGKSVLSLSVDKGEILPVNTRAELETASRTLKKRTISQFRERGVTFVSPGTTFVEAGVQIGRDVTILQNCTLTGKTVIADDAVIGPNTHLHNTTVGERSKVEQVTASDSAIGEECAVGPFVRLGAKSEIGDGTVIDSFVVIERAAIGANCCVMANALIANATLGIDVTVGANAVFADSDGVTTHHTIVSDHAYIGANSTLVAPLVVGVYGFVAAGSVVTEDVPANALVIGRSRAEIKENWMRRSR
jgi:bifunctional UDP-N-acetylglucosamine pyrophosphorylase/glucosamine-1-phosphate N-acetyltransferase